MSKAMQKTARGTLWQGTSQVMLALAGYVVAVILARSLGPADFGVYGLVYSFLMAVELVTLFGIPGAVSRLTAEGRDGDGRVRATGLGLVALTCSAAFVVLWFGAPLLAGWLGIPAAYGLLRIAIIDVPCFGVYFLIAHVLNGRRDFAGQSVAALAYAFTKMLGTGVLAFTGLTIAGALLVNVAASLVGLACVAWRAGRQGIGYSPDAAGSIWQIAVPIASIALGTQLLLNVDLWFLGGSGAGVGENVGGYYVAAKNLARFPNLIAFVLNAVLVPSIAHAIATGDPDLARRIVRGTMRFLALTLLPGCALIAVKAGPLMALLFSAEYAAGARFLQLLILANGLLQTLCSTLITILVASRHQRAGAAIALLAVLPALLFNAVLIPWQGALGAALAACLAALLAAASAAYVTWRSIGSFFEPAVLAKVSLATLLSCAALALVPFEGPLVLAELVFAALLFFVLCLVLRLVTRADLHMLPGRGDRP
jgi:O-antigen/teichoic acid export membrane protein